MTETLTIENDTYPEIAQSFVISVFDDKDMLYRNFGPFETKEEAKEWFSTGTNELGGSLLEKVKNALKDQAKEKAGNEIKDIIKEAVYKAIKSKKLI